VKKIVEFEVEGGPPVYVEVEAARVEDDDALAGFEPVERSLARGMAEEAGGRWRGALEQVRPAIEDMVEVFRAVATPEEIAVEFSLKLNTKVNAFVFSSDGEATFKVALKWSNPKAAGGGGAEAGTQAGTRSGA
jgi:hypothetical protein